MEKYLGICLDSLILPTKEEREQLEVIVVNDGSKDNSLEIMKNYETKYPETFRIVDKENGGHGSCCNVGLSEAKGKFIHFLDSDDWFDDKNYPIYINRLKNETADIVLTKKVEERENNATIHNFENIKYDSTYNVESFSYFLDKTNYQYLFSIHEGTFSTKLLREYCSFSEHVSYDDMQLRIAPLYGAKSIAFYDMTLYHYYIGRDDQSMNKAVLTRKFNDFGTTVDNIFNLYSNKQGVLSDPINQYARRVLIGLIRELLIIAYYYVQDEEIVTTTMDDIFRKVDADPKSSFIKKDISYKIYKFIPFKISVLYLKVRDLFLYLKLKDIYPLLKRKLFKK